MANFIDKFAKALACSKLKNEVTRENIDEAFDFLTYKLEFLRNYDPVQIPMDFKKSTKKERVDKIKDQIVEKFSGREITLNELYLELKPMLSEEKSKITIERYL